MNARWDFRKTAEYPYFLQLHSFEANVNTLLWFQQVPFPAAAGEQQEIEKKKKNKSVQNTVTNGKQRLQTGGNRKPCCAPSSEIQSAASLKKAPQHVSL